MIQLYMPQGSSKSLPHAQLAVKEPLGMGPRIIDKDIAAKAVERFLQKCKQLLHTLESLDMFYSLKSFVQSLTPEQIYVLENILLEHQGDQLEKEISNITLNWQEEEMDTIAYEAFLTFSTPLEAQDLKGKNFSKRG